MSNFNDALLLPEHVQAERAPKLVQRYLITLELTTLQPQANYQTKNGEAAPLVPIIVRESVVSDVSPIVYLSQKRYVEVGADGGAPIEWHKCVVLFSQSFGMAAENPEDLNQKLITP